MESVTLENFRCFREKQTVKLAPLTLLVGENSTGKTSFLALIRALGDFAHDGLWPDFKQPPYDLGSFDEIAYSRGRRSGSAESFVGGVVTSLNGPSSGLHGNAAPIGRIEFEVTFCKQLRGTAPIPVRQRIVAGEKWIDECIDYETDTYDAQVGTRRGSWKLRTGEGNGFGAFAYYLRFNEAFRQFKESGDPDDSLFRPVGDSPSLVSEDANELDSLDLLTHQWTPHQTQHNRTYAAAPVRSSPRRAYNPARSDHDAEGDYVPMYLAELARSNSDEWQHLKQQIDTFGRQAGLFDELRVRLSSRSDSDPFQLQVRKGTRRAKGPFRNLIDVGYGVSQVLPLITELLRPNGAKQFLLQQPEVHLHPSAQAELGSLFSEVAGHGRQLVVETHSDHLIDRIRMDVRDGKTSLTPDDVRILYFERDGLDVKIHEIWYDKMGNLENTPPGYRSFFMKEIERSLWPPD